MSRRQPASACACLTAVEVRGAAVAPFTEHLELVSRNIAQWETTYRCPFTFATWLQTYPSSGAQGGGPPLLTRLAPPSQEEPDR